MKRKPSWSFSKMLKWKILNQTHFTNGINTAVEQKTGFYIAAWDHGITSRDL